MAVKHTAAVSIDDINQHDRRYLGRHYVFSKNRAELLVDGQQAYPAMLEAIANAKRSIAFESYIFSADVIGERFLVALCERAKDGVAVRVIIDGVGSMDTSANFWQPLINAGGEVVVFHPPRKISFSAKNFWVRDHRKLLIIDDYIAFIGGINIGREYAPTEWGGANWHDIHAQIHGPVAHGLMVLFNRTWRQVTKKDWNVYLGPPQEAGNTAMQILEGRLTKRHSVRRAYLHAIANATSTIRITNAYCIPDRDVQRALQRARKRGVRVQLLLSGRTDIRSIQFAGRYLYRRLLKWGIEIYEWTERVLHAKTAVVDGYWCSIGSYNLDRRSLLHNLEANVACVDKKLGTAFDQQFENDLRRSHFIDPTTWHRRPSLQKLLEFFFYQLRYLL
ncbi:MAG: cardiolipin synthase ClsB [Deltaproteobacteria bacterium]|nr:cardiolipin synthase ClsB [Deltaproteobacteria bacterium]